VAFRYRGAGAWAGAGTAAEGTKGDRHAVIGPEIPASEEVSMSRTDKDVPNWVRTEYYTPHHARRCPNGWWNADRHLDVQECTLTPTPVRASPSTLKETSCHWSPSWVWKNYTPSSQDRRWYWWGPDRARVRDACRKAAQEYNGSGETEIEVPQWNHHHTPISGGWWD
jgi:hypothetical protein